MLNPIDNALTFLISTLFDLYIFVLIVRLVLVYIRADYYNPISQFVIKLTQVPVVSLKRFMPNFKQIEISTIAYIFLLEMIKFTLLGLIVLNVFPNIIGLLVLGLADMLKGIVNLFFYAILIQAIMSWVQPNHPTALLLKQMTSPLMRPFYRIIPPINGIDITPIPVMIFLQLILIVCVAPLLAMGQVMAFK